MCYAYLPSGVKFGLVGHGLFIVKVCQISSCFMAELIGAIVEVQGLSVRADLNGVRGKVVSYWVTKGRCAVRFSDGETALIKPTMLSKRARAYDALPGELFATAARLFGQDPFNVAPVAALAKTCHTVRNAVQHELAELRQKREVLRRAFFHDGEVLRRAFASEGPCVASHCVCLGRSLHSWHRTVVQSQRLDYTCSPYVQWVAGLQVAMMCLCDLKILDLKASRQDYSFWVSLDYPADEARAVVDKAVAVLRGGFMMLVDTWSHQGRQLEALTKVELLRLGEWPIGDAELHGIAGMLAEGGLPGLENLQILNFDGACALGVQAIKDVLPRRPKLRQVWFQSRGHDAFQA